MFIHVFLFILPFFPYQRKKETALALPFFISEQSDATHFYIAAVLNYYT